MHIFIYIRKHWGRYENISQQECIPVRCVPPACYCMGGGSLSRGVSAQGVAVWEGLSRGSLPGGLCPGDLPDRDPPVTESQTGVKTLPCRNLVVGGNHRTI